MLSLKQSYYPFLINSDRKLGQNEYSSKDLWHDIKKSDIYIDSLLSLVFQRLKHLSTMRETWVRSLGHEDPLEKEMATHSSIFAWRIPWTEEPGGLL